MTGIIESRAKIDRNPNAIWDQGFSSPSL